MNDINCYCKIPLSWFFNSSYTEYKSSIIVYRFIPYFRNLEHTHKKSAMFNNEEDEDDGGDGGCGRGDWGSDVFQSFRTMKVKSIFARFQFRRKLHYTNFEQWSIALNYKYKIPNLSFSSIEVIIDGGDAFCVCCYCCCCTQHKQDFFEQNGIKSNLYTLYR